MERSPRATLYYLPSFFLLFSSSFYLQLNGQTTSVDVGVVLDLQTLPGKKDWASISLAVDDFYAVRPNANRRVVLHPRDSRTDVVGAASAALDLLKNVKVQAIIGPITSSQTEFVANLGNKTQVPVISISATSPSLSSLATPFFVRANLNDSSQVDAITAILKFHGWREAVLVYEDTEYGSGIIPYLIDAFNTIDVRVPYRSVVPSNASSDWLSAELSNLMSMQTRVFVVHTSYKLGSRFFRRAKAAGLMKAGDAWIVTDGVANNLDTADPAVLESMEGVLGVRSFTPRSTALTSFISRWRARFARDNPTVSGADPTLYQFWAYDAAKAVTMAAEKVGTLDSQFDGPRRGADNSTDLARLGISKSGPEFLQAILNTQFRGLTGEFRLVDGQLQSSAFEIVNVIRKRGDQRIGFWSPAMKLVKDWKNASHTGLKTVIWPGDSKDVPKGWEIPTMGKKLKIAVPVRKGFEMFVKVERDATTGQVNASGYCIDVFEAVRDRLPYFLPVEYEPFDTDSYDSLVSQVNQQKYDAVVGDTTIIANRSLYVDFTLPYTESGVSMMVTVKEDKSKNMWIFLKPLTTDLWLASLAFFFYTGFVIWVIEHRINPEFRGPPPQQIGTIFYFAFSTLVFAHKERLESNLSRFAVIIWVFVVLILTSSYTASLTSMLTLQQLQLSVDDVDQLHKNNDYVGYQDASFVKGMLIHKLGFHESKLKNYSKPEQYADALQLGSKNGGVAAIFDELPYLRLFLSERCSDYSLVGRTYKTDGFGFVFPKGSLLVPDVSRAILNVTQGDQMAAIEKKWFGDQTACPSDASSAVTSTSLDFRSFGGLFLITGCISSIALLVFFAMFVYREWEELKDAASPRSLWVKVVQLCRHYDRKDLTSHTFKDYGPSANDGDEGSKHNNATGDGRATPNNGGGPMSPISVISASSYNLNFASPMSVDDERSRSFREKEEAQTAIELARQ